MREQKGYVFHKGKSWFVRYCDDVLEADGTVKRKLVCKKLDVEYGGDYRTERSVRPFVEDILAPINAGLVNAQSTMSVSDFIESIYLKQYVEKHLRASTQKQYWDIFENHLKPHLGKLTLRSFRTVHGETMLQQIAARRPELGRYTLRHIKAFLSGAFKQAKRLGILDGMNPIQDVSIPHAPEGEETYAYSLDEVKRMVAVLEEPARTVVLCAALSGLRKGEIRGLRWEDFDGKELRVERSVWESTINEPKTRSSRAPIPVVKQLADALETHKQRSGKLAQPDLPIFQAGNGSPLNLTNLASRVIVPALSRCVLCAKQAEEHSKAGDHDYQRSKALPVWHGWHAFRRGLATNLHLLGVKDKDIQAILRHSNVRLTLDIYIKSVSESQVTAMDTLSEKFGTCNDLATEPKGPVN